MVNRSFKARKGQNDDLAAITLHNWVQSDSPNLPDSEVPQTGEISPPTESWYSVSPSKAKFVKNSQNVLKFLSKIWIIIYGERRLWNVCVIRNLDSKLKCAVIEKQSTQHSIKRIMKNISNDIQNWKIISG